MRHNSAMAADRITQQAIELVAENRIRQAMEEGQFDNLPGLHQPIPDLDLPYDPDWWIKQWVRREVLSREIAEGGAARRKE